MDALIAACPAFSQNIKERDTFHQSKPRTARFLSLRIYRANETGLSRGVPQPYLIRAEATNPGTIGKTLVPTSTT
jgi:hypothetical protein